MTNYRTTILSGFLVVILACGTVRAQEVTMEAAQAYGQAGEWEKAAEAYASITKADPDNALAWYRLGYVYHQNQQYEQAVRAWKEADARNFAPGFTQYNLGAAYARLGQKDDAFSSLERALEAGFTQVQTLRTDDDLAALRSDARFEALVEAADRKARPCVYEEKYQQFAFWVGEWTVANPQGQQVGTNRIEQHLNGCLMLENWTGGSGGLGKSVNYYDVAQDRWKQVWVDGSGGNITFTGTFRDGAMRFEGVNANADGSTSLMKMTFTPLDDGRVRQYVEESKDDGKTWNVWFDGYYTKQ